MISLVGSQIFVDGNEPAAGELLGFSGSTYTPYSASNSESGYALISNKKCYVAGYSIYYYITRIKFNTDTPLSSISFTLTCITDNTNDSYQRGLVVSTDANLANNYTSFQNRSDLIKVRFPASSPLTTTVTYNGTIPAGDFYVYLGPGTNDVNGKYSTIYSRKSDDYPFDFIYTNLDLDQYTISYNANGGTGTMSSQTITAGQSLTLPESGFTPPEKAVHGITLKDEDGSSISSSYATFIENYFENWKIENKNYKSGSSYTPTGDTVCYANWSTLYQLSKVSKPSKTETVKITYDKNGGQCDTAAYSRDKITTYDHIKWVSSSGKEYDPNVKLGGPAAYTYTAKFQASSNSLSFSLPTAYYDRTETKNVTFNYQNATSGNSTSSSTYNKRVVKEFIGWGESAEATVLYTQTYSTDKSTTLYANWGTTTITYGSISLPTPLRTGYIFKGWSTSSSASSGSFNSYTPTSDISTLYAIWEEEVVEEARNLVIYLNDTKKFVPVIPYIYTGTTWKKVEIYRYHNSSWGNLSK